MKQSVFCATLLLLFFTGGCASGPGAFSDTTTTETPVPGEKISDDRVVPGSAPGSSASVRW